jgi:hypothetical protein
MLEMILLVFGASLSCVFLLGLNSRVMRDEKVGAASVISWFITISQFALTWAVLNAKLSPAEYILSAGLGGSMGITFSHYFYVWADKNEFLGGKK